MFYSMFCNIKYIVMVLGLKCLQRVNRTKLTTNPRPQTLVALTADTLVFELSTLSTARKASIYPGPVIFTGPGR